MYHYFPGGKVQIACESLDVYAQRVEDFIERALSSERRPQAKVRALFEAFAARVEEGHFLRSCAVGAVSLDLGEDLEPIRASAASAFATWIATIAAHLDLASSAERRSFAGLLLSAIEGAYVRCRAERSATPFREAGHWLSRILARP